MDTDAAVVDDLHVKSRSRQVALWATGFAALVVGCGRNAPPPPASADASVVVVVVPDAGVDAVDCGKVSSAFGSVRRSYKAKDYGGARQAARRGLVEAPEACRDGVWYLTAAMLLEGGGARPVEAPGLVIRTRDEALAAAIAELPDGDVLVYVAFVAALGGTTQLPPDACAFMEAEVRAAPDHARRSAIDDASYVCGHVARVAGDAAAARARFGAIEQTGQFADLELRQAEAELALGNEKAAKALARKAAAKEMWRLSDRAAIVAAANAIAK